MNHKVIALFVCIAACDREENIEDRPPDAPFDTVAADATAAVPDTSPTGSRQVVTEGHLFDPATVQVGDTMRGMRVVDVRRPPDDYIISFTGPTELQGEYRPHHDYPEVKLPCFWVDRESWRKLPRARNDQRVIWFCFANADDAIQQLGRIDARARATIVIDNYQTMLNQSDVIDRAKLIRVVKKEAIQ